MAVNNHFPVIGSTGVIQAERVPIVHTTHKVDAETLVPLKQTTFPSGSRFSFSDITTFYLLSLQPVQNNSTKHPVQRSAKNSQQSEVNTTSRGGGTVGAA